MIAIVDCNSFYCGCERLFYPALWQQPVVVLSNNDGCIISRTDEAKALGIAMGEPYFKSKDAIQKHGIAVFSSNYHLYGNMSQRVMDTMRSLVGAQHVEVYSVDEAFINLSAYGPEELHAMATHIKHTVETWTGIKVSIGVAPTKVLAKAANWVAKKHKAFTKGVVVLETPEKVKKVLEQLPIADVWGVGRKYAQKLEGMGHTRAWHLAQLPGTWARTHMGGVVGLRLHRELNGIPAIDLDERLVDKQMIATTRMFGKPVSTLADIKEAVATYTARALEKLRRQHSVAACISVFVVQKEAPTGGRFSHGRNISCSYTMPVASAITPHFIAAALQLAEQLYTPGQTYAKAGVTLSQITPAQAVQQNAFAAAANPQLNQLMQTIDNTNFSMRDDAVKFAASGTTRNWKMRQEHRSPRHTTRWQELPVVR
ncbi:MAG: Y-family DNA polymerase [Bacteroidetes bacterium]|nr:MAG: Y-family DNA polymerase [Bacteroidota bacterium]